MVQPEGIVSTGWPAVEHTCRTKLGIEFDGWQHGAGRLILAKRADGKLAVTVGGVGMSLPRQVGKTYLLAGLIFGLCINTPGLLVIWSAHHARTHGETFLAMQGFAKRAKAAPYIEQIFVGSGDEEIRFANGSRILFGARERGFGRGIPGVDILVMDEAQILSDKALENMLATMNTSLFGLALYIGTPPKPDDNSEAFTRMRDEALDGELTKPVRATRGEMVWIECSADDNADIDDRKQYAKANPSHPHRTPIEAFLRLRKKLSPDGFKREALGIWGGAGKCIDLAKWSAPPILNRAVDFPSRVVLVADVSPDRKSASIGVTGDVDGKSLMLGFFGRRDGREPGTDWVVPKIVYLKAKRDIDEVWLTPGQAAKTLQPALVAAGVEYQVMTHADMGASCSGIQEAVKAKEPTLLHVGQPELDAAVANATTRYVGEVEVWDRRDQDGPDISPLVACSGALFKFGMQEAPMPAIY